ncbi:MAG: hypothetical protein A3J76_05340 [Candidatus Moranbacteria bacterium RBG_13_45_13]|nr:MAG: hypothetical protein A3J76_05340 [Candidatus Moranbacteria bacterium RBG_13_45_13]
MINPTMRLKILILPLAIVVSAAVAIMYIKPAFSSMKELRQSLAVKQAQLDEIKAQNQRIQKIKASWEALGEEKTLVQRALPETKSVDFYVSELTSKASRSGVLLTEIKPGNTASNVANQTNTCESDSANSSSSGAVQSPTNAPSANVSSVPTVSGPEAASSAVAVSSCIDTINLNMNAKGTWEQLLDFFKYLEDMNRISNFQTVAITSGGQTEDQAASDILSVSVSIKAFYKAKSQSALSNMASGLASQAGLNQKAIDKLKNVIFSVYSAPAVSPVGQRNLFK